MNDVGGGERHVARGDGRTLVADRQLSTALQHDVQLVAVTVGSIAAAVAAARFNSPELPVEVEVENLQELQQAMDAKVERVLLDNFDLEMLRQAVALNNRQLQLEASGGVTLETIRAIADTGVDYISTGALTKDIKAVDLSMRFSA